MTCYNSVNRVLVNHKTPSTVNNEDIKIAQNECNLMILKADIDNENNIIYRTSTVDDTKILIDFSIIEIKKSCIRINS